MKFLQKLRGLLVINDVSDEEDAPPLEPPVEEHDALSTSKPRPPKRKTCWDKYEKVFYVLLLALLTGLVVPIILMATVFAPQEKVMAQRGYCYINGSFKFCCGGDNDSQVTCEARGCCYEASSDAPPSCYHSEPSQYGYVVTATLPTGKKSSPLKLVSLSSKLGNSETLELNLTSVQPTTPFGGDAWISKVTVERSGDNIIRLTFSSPGHEEGTLIKDNIYFNSSSGENPKLEVQVSSKGEAFNITVYRKNSTEVLFQTLYGPMIMGDGYMEITTTVPTKSIYGLGSRYSADVSPLFDEYEEWTLNSRDTSFSNQSLPSTHPFYMGIDSFNEAYGVYVQTSAPLQIGTVPAPGLSFRTVIGTFKILIMAGPTPRDVSEQYTGLVGRPSLPPYWALGFHLCRTVLEIQQHSTFEEVASAMDEAGLPYESDCLDARLAYPDAFSALPDWAGDAIQTLHAKGRQFVATSYPFVVNASSAMTELQSTDFLLKLNGSSPYYGAVAGAAVAYPDYMNENIFSDWMNESFVVTEAFGNADGLLLLQNAPLNEAHIAYGGAGAVDSCSSEHPEMCCSRSGLQFQVDPAVDEPSDGTICWSAVHAALDSSLHLAHHNAYGLYHTKRVVYKRQTMNKTSRVVVLSSATQPGSGEQGGHFSEGYTALLHDQKRALLQVLEMGLAGVPLTGTPPCGSRDGFDVEANEEQWAELCFRSYLNSLLWPLLLSHYELGARSTGPTDVTPGFANQLTKYMKLRYALLPTLYTLFVEASDTGTPILRHLFYEFPHDQRSLDIGEQFMVGSSLLVVPNFVNDSNAGVTSLVPAYFPPGRWYDLLTGRLVADGGHNGTDTVLYTSATDINIFALAGAVIFRHSDLANVSTAEGVRQSDYLVYIFVMNSTDWRNGSMYYDDGITPRDAVGYTATRVEVAVHAAAGVVVLSAADVSGAQGRYVDDTRRHSSTIATVVLFGLGVVNTVTVDGTDVDVQMTASGALSVPVSFDWTANDVCNVVWN